MNLPALTQSFVLHFGEMGSRWGISRTVAQIYALLFVSKAPLCADEIVEALGISRSNASISLRELQGWNLVVLRHFPEDRREFFTTPGDVWQILRVLVEERKKREIDPTLPMLRDLLRQEPEGAQDRHARQRLSEMERLMTQLVGWYDEMKGLETERLVALLALGSKAARLLEATDRMVPLGRGARRPRGA